MFVAKPTSNSPFEDRATQAPVPDDLGRRVVSGGVALGVARVATRLLNLAFLFTVARWLGPSELGVFAVVTLVLTALEQLSETGLRPALIQHQRDISIYLASVRTVQAVRGFLLAAAVFLLAPWVCDYFESPRSIPVMRAAALVPLIQGLEPLFDTIARKELAFPRLVTLQVTASSLSLLVGLVSAYFRPDVWALVNANVVRALAMTIGAHVLTRPEQWRFTFDLRPLKDLHKFGFWVFVNYVLAFAFLKGGDWVVGRVLDLESLAIYQMAMVVTTTATGEIGGVLSQLSFPLFSKLKSEPQRFWMAFRNSLGVLTLVGCFMGAVMCACSPDFIPLILGAKWMPCLPLVPWSMVWALCSMLAGILNGMIFALGRPRTLASIFIGSLLVLGGAVVPAARHFGTVGVAGLLALAGAGMQAARYIVVARLLSVSPLRLVELLYLPCAALIISVLLTRQLRAALPALSHLTGMALCAVSATASFGLVLAVGSRWLHPGLPEIKSRLRTLLYQKRN